MYNKAKDLEKVALGIAAMFGLYWMYSIVISPLLPFPDNIKGVTGLAVLYVAGLGLFFLSTKNISKQPFSLRIKSKVSFRTILLCFLLHCTAFMVLNILSIIISLFGGVSASTESDPLTFTMAFMLLVFNPVIEELVFRHLFATRLMRYGERFYILTSAYCFAILHGVSIGLTHIVYTFIMGLIWAYLTVKSGSMLLAVIMHSLSNLFNSVIIQLLMEFSVTALGIYSLLIMALGITGLILFIKNRKKIVLDDSPGFMNREAAKGFFTNRGIFAYTVLTLVFMVLKVVLNR
ncbi:MAG: CPBP family intramembrane metalloprotease [Ruminococcaceae bacterium]|nr:CPBP family intramembrane metalloprotease [Oscillospiraceae bacterium]